MAVGEIAYNPYDGVGSIEWDLDTAVSGDNCHAHKINIHTHPCNYGPTGLVEVYAGIKEDNDGRLMPDGEEYTIVGAATQGSSTGWPYDIDEVQYDIVTFPQHETSPGNHMNGVFWTGNDDLIPDEVPSDEGTPEDRRTVIETILNTPGTGEPVSNGPFAKYAHPSTYNDSVDDAEQYDRDLNRWSLASGLTAMEVYSFRSRFEREDTRYFSRDVWERVNMRNAPWRPLWNIGVDDARCLEPGEQHIGEQLDRQWTTVLLKDDEFDPSDQKASREAIGDAMTAGRMFAHRVVAWDTETEDKPDYPKVTNVEVDGQTITLTATDYDEINWRRDGEVVGNGESYSFDETDIPYVYAELVAAGSDVVGETATQPFTVDDGSLARINPETGAQINADDYKMARR